MRLPENLGLVLTVLFSYVIPKKKNYWVFTSFLTSGKYTGECKYVFEYAVGYLERWPTDIKVAYAVNSQMSSMGFSQTKLPIRRNRWFWMFALLRAEIVVVDGVKVGLGLGRFKYVQLWHGTGFKNILLHNNHETNKGVKSIFSRSFMLKAFLKKTILITATSQMEKVRRQKAFQSENVIITGSPRNDYFNQKSFDRGSQKIILYAPTFRKYASELELFNEEEWHSLNELMKRQNSIFIIKKHPADKSLKVPNGYSNIRDVTKKVEDIEVLLGKADVLITDYSSISTDYVLTNRPIVFYTYDSERYLTTDRTMYYDLNEILPGPFAQSYNQLFELLTDLSWFYGENYQQKYSKFKHLLHKYDDGKSSERAFMEILKLKKK